MPGAYAGNDLQDDPNPTSGAVVLGGLFFVAFLGEATRLFVEIFSGYSLESDSFTWTRVGLVSLGLILLWVGVSWVRWVLAAGAFVFGAGLLVHSLIIGAFNLLAGVPGIASILLGFIYLALALYTGFASNAAAFGTQQSRQPEKALPAAPVVVMCGLFLALLLSMRMLCLAWHTVEERRALAFADESIQALAANWDPDAFDQRADPGISIRWPVLAKHAVFADLKRWGALRKIDDHSIRVHGGIGVEGIEWRGYYNSENTLEHGHGSLSLELKRGVFSPWRITAWTFRSMDRKPPAP